MSDKTFTSSTYESSHLTLKTYIRPSHLFDVVKMLIFKAQYHSVKA